MEKQQSSKAQQRAMLENEINTNALKLLDYFGGDLPMDYNKCKRKLSSMGLKEEKDRQLVYNRALSLITFP